MQKSKRDINKTLKKYGMCVIEGAFNNTSDDRKGRWYLHDLDADLIDKDGPGHTNLEDAYREGVTAGLLKQIDKREDVKSAHINLFEKAGNTSAYMIELQVRFGISQMQSELVAERVREFVKNTKH